MRRFLLVLVVVVVVVVVAGCKDEGAAASRPAGATTRALAGVYPEQWKCDSIATPSAIGELLGGAARPVDSAAPVERGLPHPCNYEVQAREIEYWTFDVDCRDGMKQRADALFEQYKAMSREAIEHYRTRAATSQPAASKSRDGGPEPRAPEPAAEVAVGSRGLDHRGQGLIFIDDDAPCYVRVVGSDAIRRLELARLIARNLTFANAPMTPRPAQ
jgi:hypothetical protein